VRVHPHALKHGVAAEDAARAAAWPVWVEPLGDDDEDRRELRLGFDRSARLLETVVVIESDGELVIHAMPARRKYLDLLS
jgi:hypothetical protein